MAEVTASMMVDGPATARAAAAIVSVIEAVVLGLTTRICMERFRGRAFVQPRALRRPSQTMTPSVSEMTRKEKSVVTVPSA